MQLFLPPLTFHIVLEDLLVHILIRYIVIDLLGHLQGNHSYLHEDKVINRGVARVGQIYV